MYTVLGAAFPAARNTTLPAFDTEISFISPPTEGPAFRTVSGDMRNVGGLHINRGRPNELGRFNSGSFSCILNNRSGYYDPNYTSSPFYGNIKPDRRIRQLARWNGVTYCLFDGYIDGLPQSFVPPREASVAISAHDTFKALAQAPCPTSSYELAVRADTPTNWWRLNESGGTAALDSGYGTSTPLTYTVSPTLGATAIVPYDGGSTAATFSATAIAKGLLSFAAAYSFEFWFKAPTTNAGATDWYLLDMPKASLAAQSIEIYVQGSYWSYPGAIGVSLGGALGNTISTTRYDDNVAHHVVVTADTTNNYVYVDGALITTIAGAGLAGGALSIGNLYPGVGYGSSSPTGFPGQIQEVAYYAYVLSAAQVLNHYNAGKTATLGEATGTRIARLLTAAGIPTADQDIDTGNATLGSYELPGGKLLDYCTTLNDTEQGYLYAGLDAAMSTKSTFNTVFRQRNAVINTARSTTSQATFGDGGGSELKFAQVLYEYDDSKIYNDIRFTRSGGSTQVSVDAASQHDYFDHGLEKTGLWQTDLQANDQADFTLSRYKAPVSRIVGLVVKPQADPTNLWPHVLGREIGDRITVKIRPPQGGTETTAFIIEGVRHDWDGTVWVTTWALSATDAIAYWILDDSTYSVLDSTTRLAA